MKTYMPVIRLALACLVVMPGLANAAKITAPAVPAGWLAVDENVWNVLIREPADHFLRARDEYEGGNAERAADEMLHAVAFVMIEESRARDGDRERLDAVATKLEEFAHEMRTARHTRDVPRDKLDAFFGQACHALTEHYQQLARDARERHEKRALGVTLYAAAEYLAQAQSWAHVVGDDRVIEQARSAANQIIAGDELLPGAGHTALDQLAQQTLILRQDWLTKIDPIHKIGTD
jgi:hypothetical protein